MGGIADAFLLHDRDVVRRGDDSVARSGPSGPFLVRRSRGYVPLPLPLPVGAPEPILALGGFLQSTVTVAVGEQAFPSQHVGDLDTEAARAFLEEVIANLEGFLAATPRVLALDLHPDYPSRQLAWSLAAERGGEVLELQHHLAHGAAVLGEHGRFPRAGEQVGILALDGTGFGPDGTAWGGELLLLSGELAWERRGFLKPCRFWAGTRRCRSRCGWRWRRWWRRGRRSSRVGAWRGGSGRWQPLPSTPASPGSWQSWRDASSPRGRWWPWAAVVW